MMASQGRHSAPIGEPFHQGRHGCDVAYAEPHAPQHPVAGIKEITALQLDGQARARGTDSEQERGQDAGPEPPASPRSGRGRGRREPEEEDGDAEGELGLLEILPEQTDDGFGIDAPRVHGADGEVNADSASRDEPPVRHLFLVFSMCRALEGFLN